MSGGSIKHKKRYRSDQREDVHGEGWSLPTYRNRKDWSAYNAKLAVCLPRSDKQKKKTFPIST